MKSELMNLIDLINAINKSIFTDYSFKQVLDTFVKELNFLQLTL